MTYNMPPLLKSLNTVSRSEKVIVYCIDPYEDLGDVNAAESIMRK